MPSPDFVTLTLSPDRFRLLERFRGELRLETGAAGAVLHARVRMVGSIGHGAENQRLEWEFKGAVGNDSRWFPERGAYLDDAAGALHDPVTLTIPVTGPDETLSFPDVLERLATLVPQPIVADGYLRSRVGGSLNLRAQPLARVLERVCQLYGSECRLAHGYLRFRHQDWADARAAEPPARRVRQWQEALRQRHALPFTALLEVIGRLTPEQSGVAESRLSDLMALSLWRLLEEDTEQSGSALRLLASLTVVQWRTLEAGRSLPLRTLSPAALAWLRRTVADKVDAMTGYESAGEDGEPPFKPGEGFDEEDRLEAALTQGILTLRRTPAEWGYSKEQIYYPDDLTNPAEGQALPPEKELTRVRGEFVEVVIQIPGAQAIRHYFLASSPDAVQK